MSFAGAVKWTLSSSIFTSMVSVGAPGMANSTTSLWFSLSAYATVLGATLIRSSGILAPSFYTILFRNFHFGDQLGAGATPEHVIGHWCGVALEPGSHRIAAGTRYSVTRLWSCRPTLAAAERTRCSLCGAAEDSETGARRRGMESALSSDGERFFRLRRDYERYKSGRPCGILPAGSRDRRGGSIANGTGVRRTNSPEISPQRRRSRGLPDRRGQGTGREMRGSLRAQRGTCGGCDARVVREVSRAA